MEDKLFQVLFYLKYIYKGHLLQDHSQEENKAVGLHLFRNQNLKDNHYEYCLIINKLYFIKH